MVSSTSTLFLLQLIVVLICAPLNEAQESDFIVGGAKAKEGEVPYQISITYKKEHRCGGSIIGNCWILTAAHCVHNYKASTLSILAGTTKLNKGGVRVPVEKIITHENYDISANPKIINDIALLKLKTCLNYTDNIKPVNLSSSTIGKDVTGVVSGWGYTAINRRTKTNDLKILRVTTITNEKCAEKGKIKIPDGDICTLNKRGEGFCQGDSGGPLVEESTKAQIGLVSANVPCARGIPDIYTRVSSYIKWIEDNQK